MYKSGSLGDIVQQSMTAERAVWIGAASFEDRCTASLSALASAGAVFTEAIVLDYGNSSGSAVEVDLRRKNISKMRELGARLLRQEPRLFVVNAYSFQELQDCILALSGDADLVVADISCFTKIHTLALASCLPTMSRLPIHYIAYSVPESYTHLGSRRALPGWRDIIVAPLSDCAGLVNETHGRGVIIPGHEADRLIVGLAELEPSGGIIIHAETSRRLDLRYVSETANRKALRQLTKKHPEAWKTYIVGTEEYSVLASRVRREIDLARSNNAPVILFPYGPKSHVYCAGAVLASEYPESSWFVYPIPLLYDLEYSSGVERTVWLAGSTPSSDAA